LRRYIVFVIHQKLPDEYVDVGLGRLFTIARLLPALFCVVDIPNRRKDVSLPNICQLRPELSLWFLAEAHVLRLLVKLEEIV
jgi:hypothetical protein